MGECLGLNLYRQQWETACNFALCNSTMTECYTSIETAQPGQNLQKYHDEAQL